MQTLVIVALQMALKYKDVKNLRKDFKKKNKLL